MKALIALTALACAVLLPALSSGALAARDAGSRAQSHFPDGFYPSWSPDGRRIVYVTELGGDCELMVTGADGTGQRPLTRNDSCDTAPDWSPRGDRIAFMSSRDGDFELYTMRPDGSDVVQLTANDSWDSAPDWSPDGTRIAFASDRLDGDYAHLYVMGADGSEPRRITVDDEYASYPDWSPDGTRIAFDGGEDDSYLDVVNADGTGRVRLTPDGSATHPAWLPDGRIAFTGADDIEAMNADGSGRRVLVATPAEERRVAISPDGTRLAFDSDAEDYSQVFTARSDGTGIRRVTGPRRAFAAGSRCSIVGTAGGDVLRGTSVDDVICGLGGNDRILGLGGDDTIDGGQGDDVVEGGAGTDHLLGNTGADRLVGGAQEDRLEGGPGADLLLAVDGRRDHADGGAGRDRARVDAGDWISFLESLL